MHLEKIRYRREYEEYQDGAEGGINLCYLELVPYDGEAQSLTISKDLKTWAVSTGRCNTI